MNTEATLADHGARIVGVEKRQTSLERRFDAQTLLLLGNLVAALFGLVGIIVMLLKH